TVHASTLLFFLRQRPPSSTLFPYTTLFRSVRYDNTVLSVNGTYLSKSVTGPVGWRDVVSRVAQLQQRTTTSISAVEAGRTIDIEDRKSTRLNSSHSQISYAVFCLKKKKHER